MTSVNSGTIFRRYLQFSFGTWLSAGLSFFTTPVVTWLIVPEEFGKSALFTLAYNLLSVSILMGCDGAFARMYYEKSEINRKKALKESMLIPLILWILFGFVLFFNREWFSYILIKSAGYGHTIVILQFSLLFGIVGRFSGLVLRLRQRSVLFSIQKIVRSVANAVTVVLVAFFFDRTFVAVLWGVLISQAAAAMLGIVAEWPFWSKELGVKRAELRNILNYGLPLLPATLIGWLHSSMDRIMLRTLTDFQEIGLYTAAFKLVAAMNMVQIGFTTMWAPMVYERYAKNPEEKGFYVKASESISAIMLTFGSGLLLAKDLVFFLFAESYRPASQIVPFLILMPVLYTISETVVIGVNLKKKTIWHVAVSSVSAITNFVLNIILVPRFGAKGAAVATGMAYVVFLACRYYVSRRLYPCPFDMKKLAFGLLAYCSAAGYSTAFTGTIGGSIAAAAALAVVTLLYRRRLVQLARIVKGSLKSNKATA